MADVGTGTSVAFGTSAYSANLEDLSWGGLERPKVATTHLGTTTMGTSMPGDIVEPGSVTLIVQYDPDTQPPIEGAAETITITYPVPTGHSNGATHAFTGYVTKFTPPDAKVDTLMLATIELAISGDVSFTDAS